LEFASLFEAIPAWPLASQAAHTYVKHSIADFMCCQMQLYH
jgi:hypothetical protein